MVFHIIEDFLRHSLTTIEQWIILEQRGKIDLVTPGLRDLGSDDMQCSGGKADHISLDTDLPMMQTIRIVVQLDTSDANGISDAIACRHHVGLG